MLKRTLVVAMSCAALSLSMTQNASAGEVTQEDLGMTPETAAAQHEQLRAMSPEERRDFMRAEHEKRIEQMEKEGHGMPAPPAPPPPTESLSPPMPSHEEMAAEHEKLRNMSVEERRAFYDRRYQELRKRAEEAGVGMPERPPWAERGIGAGPMSEEARAARREAMRNVSPEELNASRMRHYQQLRERAWEEGITLPETPPWQTARQEMESRMKEWQDKMAAYRDRVSKMSPEDREACQAVNRMEMKDRMLQMMQMMREKSARLPSGSEFAPPGFAPGGGYGQGYPHAPGGGYGAGYPSAPGGPGGGYGTYPSGPAAPTEGYGQGRPGASGYGTGSGSPWSYGR